MSKKIDFMEPFRAKENKGIYVLSVVMVKHNCREKAVLERIDAYEGEAGIIYTRNLLIRMGNYIAFGTDLEKAPWEEDKTYSRRDKSEWGYIKSNEKGDYILARANLCPAKEEVSEL